MKLTILGNNGPFPGPGSACSGYLIQDNGINILLDCGNGVLGNLQKFVALQDLNAVIVSHLHSDHISDLFVLRYAIQLKKKRGTFEGLLRLYAPGEPEEEYLRLDIKDAFILNPITSDIVLSYGDLKITFAEMRHPVKSYAVCIEKGTKRLVYSGDTSWNDSISCFASNCNLLVLDAGLLSRDKTDDNVAHLTARECGLIAKKSEAKKLLITHFWPEYSTDELLKEARAEFENVEAASLLKTYTVE